MADEVVYRLVLDGQDESPGGARAPSSTSPKNTPASATTGEDFNPFEAARKRIEREKQTELSDLAYKALQRGSSSLQQVQKEDEAEKLRQQDPYVIAAQVLDRQKKAEDVRLAGSALSRGTDIDTERKREIAEQQAADAEKAQAQAEREAAKAQALAERETAKAEREAAKKEREAERARQEAERDQLKREREQREKNMQDPVWLAQQGLQREKLMEATRLQMEANKRGITPEEVASEEERNSTIGKYTKMAETAGRYGSKAIRAGSTGNFVEAGLSEVPGVGPILQAIKANAADFRTQNQKISPFSAALTQTNVEEDIKDMKFYMKLASEQGGDRAKLESERRSLERERMRTGSASQRIENLLLKADVAIGELIGFIDRVIAKLFPEAGTEKDPFVEFFKLKPNGQAPAQKEPPLQLPDPFQFRVQRLGNQQQPAAVAVPLQRPRGLMNPAMPGN